MGDSRRQDRDRQQPLFLRNQAKPHLDQSEEGHRECGRWRRDGVTYFGATENGLLVVLAAYSGGGSGDFITLHILDIVAARAFDLAGKIYERIT